jgi:glycosyltransferase involved in cell wall biosynthesis
MPRVFIGMPVYNGERFLKEAIDSLRAQTFTDWKLLISDDASTDESRPIAEEYAKEDPRISYYRQGKNIGMFPNFKFLINQADCEYFMWAAQDDLWEKEFILVCLENIKATGAEVATTVTSIIDSHGKRVRNLIDLQHFSGEPGIAQIARYVLQPEILGKCNLMYSLFKIETVRKMWDIYPQKYEWGSDYQFSLAIVSHCNVSVDERPLFKKRAGGFSDPHSEKNDSPVKVDEVVLRPKNHIFPFGRFGAYFRGHQQAVQGTRYGPLVALLLIIRLPRSFFIYLTQRNYKKFFTLA